MIDTICLLIPKDKMTYFNGISSWDLYSKTAQYEKYVRNPSKVELDTGKYFPRLTGYSRNFGREANIRIEFSIPKLLYLNNLDEVDDVDFESVITILQNRLKIMGVGVFASILKNASVSSIHFSKNIPLLHGYTANHIISEINKISLNKSFDFAKTRFINNGQSLYAHTTSHQFVVYDKVADLKKSKKRSIDKDQTLFQQSLFPEFNKDARRVEILRFEIRISQKQKLNKLLNSLGYGQNLPFKEIFKSGISKKIIIDYWKKLIMQKNIVVLSVPMTTKDMLQSLFLSDNNIKPKQAIYLVGLYTLAREEHGLTQLRAMVEKQSHDRTWYRVTRDMRQISDSISKDKVRNWVIMVEDSLKKFETYRLKNNPQVQI